MLGSSSHSFHNHQDENEELHMEVHEPPPPPQPPPLPSSIDTRQLLLTVAQLISSTDLTAVHRVISILFSNSSAYGDSTDRLVHSFANALSLRLHRQPPPPTTTINTQSLGSIGSQTQGWPDWPSVNNLLTTQITDINYSNHNDEILQSSYLSLNQITPFIRFSHLTANQAILEAIDRFQIQHKHKHTNNPQIAIHILDFDIMHGVQWPPLMQAIAGRYPPPNLRITAAGTNLDILRRTGDRLSKFARSVGIRFRFYPLLLPNTNHETADRLIDHLSAVLRLPNEILAVNCVLCLHRLLTNREKLCLLLRKIKSISPNVVTLVENEANHNHPEFLSRFTEAVNYYAAVFESLEATLPPHSRERIEVEQVWFGREICDIVAEEGDRRKERHEKFRSWEVLMRNAGFHNISVSHYAHSQARLLLRLHYPTEGYKLEVFNDSIFLGWRNHPLFSVSSWH